MEGMLKSAPSAPIVDKPTTPAVAAMSTGHTIPDEAYAYFGIEKITDRLDSNIKTKINNILAYAYEQKQTMEIGELLYAIREIELKLGQPSSLTQSRFDQVHNYITIQRKINSLERQKEAMFDGIRTSKTNSTGE